MISKGLSPTSSVFVPAPTTVESASFAEAVSVIDDVAYGTFTVYDVTEGSKEGESEPVLTVNEPRLLSDESSFFTVVAAVVDVMSPEGTAVRLPPELR